MMAVLMLRGRHAVRRWEGGAWTTMNEKGDQKLTTRRKQVQAGKNVNAMVF
jgi:hypothetical protein